jgi:cell division protein FtsQ
MDTKRCINQQVKKNKIIIYLLFLFILSTTSGKLINDQNKLSSLISKINITGLSERKNLEISNNLNNFLYKSIFFISKDEIRKILEKYNIIQEFSIKKIYPSTLNIEIKPTKIIARVSNNGQYLVGANGKLIEDRNNSELLPYIFGEFNSQNFLSFKQNIEKSTFSFSNLKTLYFFPSGRWDILTNNDILIKLPKEHMVASLNLSKNLIDNNNFKDNKFIDLRVKNHLVTK